MATKTKRKTGGGARVKQARRAASRPKAAPVASAPPAEAGVMGGVDGADEFDLDSARADFMSWSRKEKAIAIAIAAAIVLGIGLSVFG